MIKDTKRESESQVLLLQAMLEATKKERDIIEGEKQMFEEKVQYNSFVTLFAFSPTTWEVIMQFS